MRHPDNLPAFCRVHKNGRPHIMHVRACFWLPLTLDPSTLCRATRQRAGVLPLTVDWPVDPEVRRLSAGTSRAQAAGKHPPQLPRHAPGGSAAVRVLCAAYGKQRQRRDDPRPRASIRARTLPSG
jgi:hypothetical protein